MSSAFYGHFKSLRLPWWFSVGFVLGQALISIFVCIQQIPPSHHVSSPNVNGSLNNHQAEPQTNQLSPEGMSPLLLSFPLLLTSPLLFPCIFSSLLSFSVCSPPPPFFPLLALSSPLFLSFTCQLEQHYWWTLWPSCMWKWHWLSH